MSDTFEFWIECPECKKQFRVLPAVNEKTLKIILKQFPDVKKAVENVQAL